MITEEKIQRINELSRKAKSPQGLTDAETEERAALRREYVAGFKASLEGQLDSTYILGPDGVKRKLTKKED